jgi:hypothetical protein
VSYIHIYKEEHVDNINATAKMKSITILPILLTLTQAHRLIGWARHNAILKLPRGGSSAPAEQELSLDDRVHAAMKRLGLDAGTTEEMQQEKTIDANCEGGMCTLPTDSLEDESVNDEAKDEGITEATITQNDEQDIESIASSIASEFDVPRDIVMAAIYSSFSGEGENMRIDEELARNILKAEVEAIQGVAEDCDEVSIKSAILFSRDTLVTIFFS